MKKTTKLLAGATALFLSTSALAEQRDTAALQAKALQDDVAYDIIEGLSLIHI